MSRKILLFIVVLFLFSSSVLKAQEEKVKAIFVYNFTRYIDWPVKPGNFVILVVGKSAINAELTDISTKKKVGNTNIEVINITSAEQITDCHIIYVTNSKTGILSEIVAKSQQKNVLIITEKDGACNNGAGINFVITDGKLQFEICKKNITGNGLKMATSLLTLGTVVD